ncbi:hypothetical protein [Fibrobacter sp.]|uniref:hypothetical protein n=1 Tax=Fibrobacter sp. TaxID=35828 RepID=UPI003866EE3C
MEENEIFENLMQVLWEYAETVKDLYKRRLIADDKVATGNLLNSVDTFIVYNNTEFLVTLSVADYMKYVENGRFPYGDESAGPGSLPPVSKILEWIKVKNILPTPKNGHLPTQEQLAWAISKSIEKKGIKPGRQFAETVEAVNAQYIPLIQEAVERDFDRYALYVFSEINRLVKI